MTLAVEPQQTNKPGAYNTPASIDLGFIRTTLYHSKVAILRGVEQQMEFEIVYPQPESGPCNTRV